MAKEHLPEGVEIILTRVNSGWKLLLRYPRSEKSPEGAMVFRPAPYASFDEAIKHVKDDYVV